MTTSISITGIIIPREIYAEYNLRLYTTNLKQRWLVWAIGLSIVVLSINLYYFWHDDRPFPWIPMVIVLGFAFTRIWAPNRLRAHFRKVYDKTPAISAATSLLLTSNGVDGEANFSHSQMGWPAFIGAAEHGTWLMLHLNNRTFLPIDTRKIAPPATFKDLYVLIQSQNIPVGIDKIGALLRINK